MHVKLHANARLTPKQRTEVQASKDTVAVLASRYGVTQTTIRRWRTRDTVHDRSHTRHKLNPSTSPTEEALIVALRQNMRLSLDDIVEVMHRCVNKHLSRSAIHRCLHRLQASKLPPMQDPNEHQPDYKKGLFTPNIPCGFIHIDLKHTPRLQGVTQYVFAAIDRATRFAHIEVITNKRPETIIACLENFLQAFPHKVHTILTDNGSEFTDRFSNDKKGKAFNQPSGKHLFDLLCQRENITHKLTKPRHPQTNGMVERFNRRLAEALRAAPIQRSDRDGGHKIRFKTPADRAAYLHLFVDNYNKTRLRCLNYLSPIKSLHNHTKDNTFGRGQG